MSLQEKEVEARSTLVFENKSEVEQRKVYALLFHAPHYAVQKLQSFLYRFDVWEDGAPDLPNCVYLCRNAKIATRAWQQTKLATLIVCDTLYEALTVCTVALDANIAPRNNKDHCALVATPADNWHLFGQDVPTQLRRVDVRQMFVREVTHNSIFNPLMSQIYRFSKDFQPKVKDVMIRAMMENRGREWALQELTALTKDIKRSQKLVNIVFPENGNYVGLVYASVELLGWFKRYQARLKNGVDKTRAFAVLEWDDLSKKYDCDVYELRYIFKVYERLQEKGHSEAVEDSFFEHRQALINSNNPNYSED